jgi:hypothetical protein
MRIKILEHQSPAWNAYETLSLGIATENPAKTPSITKNFWRIVHTRVHPSTDPSLEGALWLVNWLQQKGSKFTIVSSHVAPSWTVLPQMENVKINIAGKLRAAGSTSNISLSFLALSDATTLKIQANQPAGFDFSKARMPKGMGTKDDRSAGNNIIINLGPTDTVKIKDGLVTHILIEDVVLANGGGKTEFNLATYVDYRMLTRLDEKMQFTNGFRLPGKTTVVSAVLDSKYKAEAEFSLSASVYPVKRLFNPQMNVMAKATIYFMVSQSVGAEQKLVIDCIAAPGYNVSELREKPFDLVGKEKVDTKVTRLLGKVHELTVTLKPGKLHTEVALKAHELYKIMLWMIPARGPTTWNISTTDIDPYPTNTNDGLLPGFEPVEKLGVTVTPSRQAPLSIIDVAIYVAQHPDNIYYELVVIAPPAFLFPQVGCGELCTLGVPLGTTMRRTAHIKQPTGNKLSCGLAVCKYSIQIQTPEVIPGSPPVWYVESRAASVNGAAGVVTGWGEALGFPIQQMTSKVVYGGVAGMQRAQMTFNFTLNVNAGSEITIQAPPSYNLVCSRYASLRQGSLPGKLPTCTDKPLKMKLSQPLLIGSYAFTLDADLPLTTPLENSFNLILRDQDLNVVDAGFQMLGTAVAVMPLKQPTLSWSASLANARSVISMSISLNGTWTGVEAVMFTFPQNFKHAIIRPSEVTNNNPAFPVDTEDIGGWAKYIGFTDKIKVVLFPGVNIPKGEYSWSFPVKLPFSVMPAINVWQFSACKKKACELPEDKHVMVNFPMQGFEMGEISKEALMRMISRAQPCTSSRLFAFTFAAVLPSLFALLASSPSA